MPAGYDDGSVPVIISEFQLCSVGVGQVREAGLVEGPTLLHRDDEQLALKLQVPAASGDAYDTWTHEHAIERFGFLN